MCETVVNVTSWLGRFGVSLSVFSHSPLDFHCVVGGGITWGEGRNRRGVGGLNKFI